MPDTPTNWNGAYSGSQIDSLLAKANTAVQPTAMNTALANKVDKIPGKGLSTNDYTDAEKANVATALSKANAAAPQDTTYTKSESDTLLADKLDVDDIITEAEIDSWFAGA